MSLRTQRLTARIGTELAGKRLDQALALLFPDFSRSRLQRWLKEERVRLDGHDCRPRDCVAGGEEVVLEACFEERGGCLPQAIELDILHEDAHILVVNKPVGLVVHPAAGNPDGTLQNALLHHAPALVELPRGGIVHRLDKETSGLLVVAKTPAAHRALVEQLQARLFHREYRAVVTGVVTAGGSVEAPIGRHPTQRTRMAVVHSGKPALTHYRVLERFRLHSYLKINLETGRTHQIRVHMAHIRHPLVGDPLYGGRFRIPPDSPAAFVEALRGYRHQALHALRLGLSHPHSGEWMAWEAPLPEDLAALLELLREDASRG